MESVDIFGLGYTDIRQVAVLPPPQAVIINKRELVCPELHSCSSGDIAGTNVLGMDFCRHNVTRIDFANRKIAFKNNSY